MSKEYEELTGIIRKFAESGWDVIDIPSKAWLEATEDLIKAVEKADEQCGSCGCELDPMYKRTLEILKTE